MEEYNTEGFRRFTPEVVKRLYRNLRTSLLTVGLNGKQNFELSAGEKNASSQISVVVPVHDSPDVVSRCLRSLELFGGNAEIIVVDDGSKLDRTRQLLGDTCARQNWRLLTHPVALGHSRACEAGCAQVTREIICLLNSDALVTHRTWQAIGDAFGRSSEIAIVGPSTSHSSTQQTVSRAKFCRHSWSDQQVLNFAELYVEAHKRSPWLDLPNVGGFGFFIRTDIWRRFGGFDQKLADYGNELDLCERVLREGYRVVWTRGSYIHHLGSESYGKILGLAEIKQRGQRALAYAEEKRKAEVAKDKV